VLAQRASYFAVEDQGILLTALLPPLVIKTCARVSLKIHHLTHLHDGFSPSKHCSVAGANWVKYDAIPGSPSFI